MNYVLFCLTSFLLSYLFIKTTGIMIGKKSSINKPIYLLLTGIFAVVPVIFIIPYDMLPVFLGTRPSRIISLLLMMLIRAGCLSLIFGQFNAKMIYISVLSFVTNTNYTNISRLFISDSVMYAIVGCVSEAFILTLILLIFKKKKCYATVASNIEVIPNNLYILILIFLYIMSFFEYIAFEADYKRVAQIMLPFVVVTSAYIIISIITVTAHEKQNEQINKLLNLQLENQIKYYQKINDIYLEFRGFRHDVGNHFICLKSLISASENQKALEYINDISGVYMSRIAKKNYDTGNIIVDALLNDKKEKAEEFNTEIVFEGYVPTMGITNIDLCTLIGNAVDNAVEACAKDNSDKQKTINISSDFRQGYFFLKVSNPVFEKVEVLNGNKIKTSKKDKKYHGFGISNIRKTIEKYNGNINIDISNGRFTIDSELLLKYETE